MSTYERVFQYIKPNSRHQENGHALRNIETVKSLKKAQKEITEMTKDLQS